MATVAELQDEIKAKRDALIEHATKEAGGALARATITLAERALDRVAADKGRGAILEPAADLRDLRSDPALRRALQSDLDMEAQRLTDEIPTWIEDGWLVEAQGQAEILSVDGLKITAKLDDAERAMLASYPVQGFTTAEIVDNLIATLKRDFLGAVGRGIATASTPGGILAPLQKASEDHAGRVGRAAGECFLAGTQAGRLSIGGALTRAVGSAP